MQEDAEVAGITGDAFASALGGARTVYVDDIAAMISPAEPPLPADVYKTQTTGAVTTHADRALLITHGKREPTVRSLSLRSVMVSETRDTRPSRH